MFLRRTRFSSCGAHLPDQYHGSKLPDTSCRECAICSLAGNCKWHRRLQRYFDEQQYGRTACLWRYKNGDLHLYQHLRTFYNHLHGGLYGGRTTGVYADLPDKYNGSGVPDSSCCQCSICSMVGNCKWHRRLQRCADEQQHGSTACLRRYHDRHLQLYHGLWVSVLPGDFHGGLLSGSCADLSNAHDGECLPNASPNEHGLCQLVGFGHCFGRMYGWNRDQ